jgi:hypothetical protein
MCISFYKHTIDAILSLQFKYIFLCNKCKSTFNTKHKENVTGIFILYERALETRYDNRINLVLLQVYFTWQTQYF